MNKLLVCLILILSAYISHLYLHNFIFPNTYIAKVPISGLLAKRAMNVNDQLLDQPIKLQIKDRVYTYTYKDLGIIINEDKLHEDIQRHNKESFPFNAWHFVKSLQNETVIVPQVTFTEDFYRFAKTTVFDFSTEPNKVVVDDTNKTLSYQAHEEKYMLDTENFRAHILLNYGLNEPIEPELIAIDQKAQEEKISEYNTQLSQLFGSPVSIIVQDGDKSTDITLSELEIKKMVHLEYQEDSSELKISLDTNTFQTVLEPYLAQMNPDADRKVSLLTLRSDLDSLINSRVLGARSDAIIAKVDFAPNTHGEKAAKYIEVDISQQRMFLFENGQVKANYRISSGLYNPTPTGEFKIMNKAVNAYSDIYNVWMPYWMAFHHDNKLNAYFGIHELPYSVTSTGEKLQRPREFIGSPHTGGCVALDIGTAKEVYGFAEVGMPVYVFQ